MSSTLDTSDMIFVHNVFREFFDRASRLFGVGHTEHEEAIYLYASTVLRFLISHHQAEDETVWPLLHERVKSEDERISMAENQHHQLEYHLNHCVQCLHHWREGLTPASSVQQSIRVLADQAREHMDYEEAVILPLCHDHITPEEWRALPAHTLQGLSGDVLMMTLGLVRDAFDDSRRAGLEANVPPPVAALWQESGRALYARTMGVVQSL